MPTPPATGLTNITTNRLIGFAGSASNIVNNETPEVAYARYRNDSRGPLWLQYPPELPQLRMVLVARDYPAGSTSTYISNGTAKSGYILPMPQASLLDRFQVNFDDSFSFLGSLRPLTVLAGAAVGGAVGGGAVGGAVGAGIGAGVAQGISTFGDYLKAISGLSLNKFKSVLLEAPMLKRHQFVWKLSPKNLNESNIIRKIVNRLKSDMAPDGTVFLSFPYIFDIYYDPHYEWMYGFKPCVIESLDIDYAGGNPNPVHHFNGSPESVMLSINVLELEFWNRADYLKWNDVDAGTITNNPANTARQLSFGSIFSNNNNTPFPENAPGTSGTSGPETPG